MALRWLARRHADAWVVVDEAFVDLLSDDYQPGEHSVGGEAFAQPMAADYGHIPDYSLIP
ncbi:MAG: hypothetical protein H5T84_05065, partial [Thermoleophilia bacterium]|nr:hypothetical protein [Thermoleophilia bacterium]